MADLDPRWEPKVQSITLSREYYDELIARERELLDQVAALTFELAQERMRYRHGSSTAVPLTVTRRAA